MYETEVTLFMQLPLPVTRASDAIFILLQVVTAMLFVFCLYFSFVFALSSFFSSVSITRSYSRNNPKTFRFQF